MKELRLIFNNEIKFLKEQLGIDIPKGSAFMDRMCVKILDNHDKWHIIYRIKAENMNLTLTKDLKLNGNNSTLENGKITISNLDEVIIENVIFSNATIYCINKVNTLKIKNCKFINCNDNAIEIWCGANKVEIINL